MREIKFRAWSPSSRTMGEPFNLNDELLTNHFADNTDRWLGDTIFMQYTGLKDKNGVEIYEGDIVRAGFNGELTGTVVFGMYKPVMNTDEWEGHQSFYIKWHNWDGMTRGELGYWLQKNMDTQAYVIGNIYENSHLLENESKKTDDTND